MNTPDRYSRQVRFAPIGAEGQRRIRDARVAIAGCGALGSYHAAALTRAGVGYLRLIDRDYVEWNNLQRQWLYEESDARDALPKSVAAARALNRINGEVQVEPEVADLTASTASDLLSDVDLILDGCDNFETRYLINDFSVREGIPWVYGAAVSSYGLTMAVLPGETACLACLYPEPPGGAQPTCETAGVIAPITTLIGALQVASALHILSGNRESLPRTLATVDVWTGSMRTVVQPPPQPDCRACRAKDFIWLDETRRTPVSLCGRNAVQIHDRTRPLDLGDLAGRLSPLGTVRSNEFALRFEVDSYEMTVFPDGRAIIKGTTDVGIARSLYARYIGN